ncbi:hypothetical protein JYG34_02560 [Pseudomonas entomophila]|uniref:hypothetical protein n=1 Tax=Pseudomonas entomophila TaxID=312306 RepID=UPI001BCDFF59|nr:hypothetical protein [Pseudomonas entomophila]QVM91936.1 hypothetical protein JYG34_02560 [Pseudomonas entomophila]
MDQAIFEQWKMQLESLDRYENQADCQMFLAMVEAVTHCLSDDVIDVLLGTFGNAHDHGVQESVMRVLDQAPPQQYAARLAAGFEALMEASSEREWPLILLGRLFNSHDDSGAAALLEQVAKGDVLHAFLRSDSFIEEYPQAEVLLPRYGL